MNMNNRSIRNLSDNELRGIGYRALQLGMHATACAIHKEQGRRAANFAQAHGLFLHPSHIAAIAKLGGDTSELKVVQPMEVT